MPHSLPIRPARLPQDAERILEVFAAAKCIMVADGNTKQWLDDSQPYHVIHRIASFPEAHGIFHTIMEFAFARDRNIRIDTHRDNRIMQHNILQHGFSYCGIILLANGDERLAYQKINTL